MGLMHSLFGGPKKRTKKGRRRSAWIEDSTHRHKKNATKRARVLREHHHMHTRISNLPNGSHIVFKKRRR